MDLLTGYGSDSESEEEIVKETIPEVKPKIQFDLPKPKSNVPLTDLSLPEDIIIEDDEPVIDERQQKALLFAQIEQEEERSFPTRKSNPTSSSSLFSQLPTPKAKQASTKFSLFSSLPAPKENTSKDEFSLPEAKRKSADPKDDSDDDDDQKRPFKKPTIEDGPLSFLPAPKRESAILEEPEKKTRTTAPIIEKPTLNVSEPEKPVKIVKQESEEDRIKREKQQQIQRQKSQQKQQFFRNLVQSSVTTPVAKKQEVETSFQHESEVEQQPQQEYVDPMYTGGFNFPAYVDPATMNAKEGRAFAQGTAKVIDVNMNELKQSWAKAGYSEPIVSAMPVMVDGGKLMPSRDAKRQGHISHLVWDLNRKLPELEAKRSESAKRKMESKMKYGF